MSWKNWPSETGSGRNVAAAARAGSAARVGADSYLLTEIREQVLPKSEAGQAIGYELKNWAALTRYCDDGDLSIDNNHSERSLRGFAVGRNNWTFIGSDKGGRTAAVLRNFLASCELVKVAPFAWFRDVLGRTADQPFNKLDAFLPHPWALSQVDQRIAVCGD